MDAHASVWEMRGCMQASVHECMRVCVCWVCACFCPLTAPPLSPSLLLSAPLCTPYPLLPPLPSLGLAAAWGGRESTCAGLEHGHARAALVTKQDGRAVHGQLPLVRIGRFHGPCACTHTQSHAHACVFHANKSICAWTRCLRPCMKWTRVSVPAWLCQPDLLRCEQQSSTQLNGCLSVPLCRDTHTHTLSLSLS